MRGRVLLHQPQVARPHQQRTRERMPSDCAPTATGSWSRNSCRFWTYRRIAPASVSGGSINVRALSIGSLRACPVDCRIVGRRHEPYNV
jgi:hypothetical protein